MKIANLLEIADKPIPEDQLPLVASMMAIKLKEIVELMPDIIWCIIAMEETSSVAREMDLTKNLAKWLGE